MVPGPFKFQALRQAVGTIENCALKSFRELFTFREEILR